jgi:hypothetical protein
MKQLKKMAGNAASKERGKGRMNDDSQGRLRMLPPIVAKGMLVYVDKVAHYLYLLVMALYP